jgi:hypothetical protein
MVPALCLGLVWASLQPQLGLTHALPPDAHGLPALTAAQPRPPFRHARPAPPPDAYCLRILVRPPDTHVHLTPALALTPPLPSQQPHWDDDNVNTRAHITTALALTPPSESPHTHALATPTWRQQQHDDRNCVIIMLWP